MSVAVQSNYRYYPISLHAGYASNSVSPASELRRADDELRRDSSSTVRESQPSLLATIWNISGSANHDDWDGEGATAISPETISAATQLICALPEGLPPPTITPEPTGEIAFEWYRDSRHVSVLTVQDGIIRWSAMIGTGAPLYGREFFSRTVPGAALLAINAVNR
jgi:hypothetical protein